LGFSANRGRDRFLHLRIGNFFHKACSQEMRPSETKMMASFVAAIDKAGRNAACFAGNGGLF
jgi:hypothetical protein